MFFLATFKCHHKLSIHAGKHIKCFQDRRGEAASVFLFKFFMKKEKNNTAALIMSPHHLRHY